MSPNSASKLLPGSSAPELVSDSRKLAAAGKAPVWARVYAAYNRHMPPHRGRRRMLKLIHGLSRGDTRPFVWRMHNGALLALSTIEAGNLHTVSINCLENRRWDPQVENALRRLIRPGDTVVDAGANLGYISAVMAQCVGAAGQVYAFEPVPATFEQLRLCRQLNGYDNLTPLPLALGSRETTIEIGYDPNVVGQASLFDRATVEHRQTSPVQVRTLDNLIAEGLMAAPSVMKIDVEGYELDVARGAAQTLQAHRPHIIFEYNTETATLAGWNLRDMVDFLRRCADYRFYELQPDGARPLDVERICAEPGYQLLDVLATVAPQTEQGNGSSDFHAQAQEAGRDDVL